MIATKEPTILLSDEEIMKLNSKEAYDYTLAIASEFNAVNPTMSESMKVAEILIRSKVMVFREMNRPATFRENLNKVYIYSPKYDMLVDMMYDIVTLADDIITHLNLKGSNKRIINDVIDKLISGSMSKLKWMQVYNEPPINYQCFKNGVFNVTTGERVPDEEASKYHFISRRNFDFGVTNNPLFDNIMDRVFNDWSRGNPSTKRLMLEYLRAVMEGNNRGRALIINGYGGNGKSTYIGIARMLASEELTLPLNLHEMEQQFGLDGFSDATKLIVGDELKSSYRLDKIALTRAKQIVDGQTITVDVKMKQPRVVHPNACLIQSTNTPIKFGESNNAIRDRFLVVEWTNENFRRKKKELPFDLKEMMKEPDFVTKFIAFLYNRTESFTNFYIPEEVEQSMEDRLNASDNVQQFVEFLDELDIISHNVILPISILYEIYGNWIRSESPGGIIMSKRTFTERISIILQEKHNFTEVRSETNGKYHRIRLTSTPISKWNRVQFTGLLGKDLDKELKSKLALNNTSYFINPNNEISSEERKEVLNDLDAIDINNPLHKRIILSEIHDNQNKTIMSRFGVAAEHLY